MASMQPPHDWLPFDPLWRYVWAKADDHAFTPDKCARALGVEVTNVYWWRRWDKIGLWSADRACIRVGLHPVELWGDLWIYPEERARLRGELEPGRAVFYQLRRELDQWEPPEAGHSHGTKGRWREGCRCAVCADGQAGRVARARERRHAAKAAA